MQRHRSPLSGFTLVELLVALVVFMIIATAISSSMLTSMRTNRQTEQRTLIVRAAETWIERYKAGMEPRLTTSSCAFNTPSSTTPLILTCNYPKDYDYPQSEWSKWDDVFRKTVNPFKTEIRLTQKDSGANVQTHEVTVMIEDPSTKKVVEFSTLVVY